MKSKVILLSLEFVHSGRWSFFYILNHERKHCCRFGLRPWHRSCFMGQTRPYYHLLKDRENVIIYVTYIRSQITIHNVPLSSFYSTSDWKKVTSCPCVSADMLCTCGALCEFKLVQRKQKQSEFLTCHCVTASE